MTSTPKVSVVVPSRNEARHIETCLISVVESLRRAGGGEILVVDGRSTDGTREVVNRLRRSFPGIQWLDNPKRVTPAAFNIGIRAARADRIAIVSAHCRIDPDFFAAGHRRLDSGETDIVGGPIRAEPSDGTGLAWILAQVVSHRFGVGNSRFRVSRTAEYVDAVPFAMFLATVFRRVGLFSEDLVRNQDTEFFGRVAQIGVRVFLDPAMGAVYFARGTLTSLLVQGFRNAYWNVLVWRTRPAAFQVRHMVPGVFTSAIVGGTALGFAIHGVWWALAICVACYAILAALAAGQIAWRTRRWAACFLPPIFGLYHFCYGAGSLAGLRHFFRKTPVAFARPVPNVSSNADDLRV